MIHYLFTYLKRPSTYIIIVGAVALTSTGFYALASSSWWKTWPDATNAVTRYGFLIATCLAGFAAFIQSRNHDGPEALSTRIILRAPLLRMIALFIVSALTLAISSIIACITVVLRAPEAVGGLWFDFLCLALICYAFAIGWGTLLGALSATYWFTTPLALFSTFFLTTYFSDGHGSTLSQILIYPYHIINIRKLILLAIIALALWMLALAAITLRSRSHTLPRLASTAIAVASIAVIASSGYSATRMSILTERPVPSRPLCVGDVQQLCMWPDYSAYAKDFATMMERIHTLPPMFTINAHTYRQIGLTDSDDPLRVFMTEGSLWAVAPTISSQIVQDSSPSLCSPNIDLYAKEHEDWQRAYSSEDVWLSAYLTDSTKVKQSLIPPWIKAGEIDDVLAMPYEQQVQWLEQQRKIRMDIESTYGCS